MIGGTRVFIRVFREYFSTVADENGKVPILIVGAGDGGELLLREIKNNTRINYKPMGFIDDDIKKKKMVIHGLKVLGTRDDIASLVKEKRIKKVIISILSMEDDEVQSIYKTCNELNIECKRMRQIIDI